MLSEIIDLGYLELNLIFIELFFSLAIIATVVACAIWIGRKSTSTTHQDMKDVEDVQARIRRLNIEVEVYKHGTDGDGQETIAADIEEVPKNERSDNTSD